GFCSIPARRRVLLVRVPATIAGFAAAEVTICNSNVHTFRIQTLSAERACLAMRGNEKQCQATGQRMSAAQLSSFAAARVAQKCQRIGFAQTRRGRRREGRQKPEWAALDRTLSAAHSAFCSSLRLCARCFHFTPQLVVFA